jgi:hypothetical protein
MQLQKISRSREELRPRDVAANANAGEYARVVWPVAVSTRVITWK